MVWQLCYYLHILFGDRVNHWMVLNEPMVFAGAGYFLGVYALGKKGLNNFLAATHHAALAQSYGARIIKSMQKDSKVGTPFPARILNLSEA